MTLNQQPLSMPSPTSAQAPSGTLRASINERRDRGDKFTIRECVAIIVPLCGRLHEIHQSGTKLLVTPSHIRFTPGEPTDIVVRDIPIQQLCPRDRACLAPECRSGQPGDHRSSVFSLGAIVYEMVTGESVGPGMRRPTDIDPTLPSVLDTILSKALIGDPKHRPGDINALAAALHRLAPTASEAPAENTNADMEEDDIEVDVSLSMLPPPDMESAPAMAPPPPVPKDLVPSDTQGGLIGVVERKTTPAAIDPTSELAALKQRLEADPRPRYVVIKDGMDHGPFTAVELLQQIATRSFTEEHTLLDTFSNDERLISEWEEFAPFAKHARLHAEIVEEKKEIERVVTAESKATKSKALFIGLGLAGAAALALVFWYVAKPKTRKGTIVMDGHTAMNIETDAGLKAAKGHRGRGYYRSSGSDGVVRPVLAGGMSCEQAMNTYSTELKMSGNKPDITAGQYGAILNRGGYVVACGAPFSMTVNICAAIQNGRAVGVTVTTNPPDRRVASCIASRIRSMSFPSHPALDVTRTVFKGE